jgi:2-dehydro-3-deoxyglucarate aldolase/4-hydroxy-2-oxoheptanedioate aldolase
VKASALKESLRQGHVAIGTWVFEFNSPGIARLLASTGVDFVVYDMEHSGFGIDTIRALISQARPLNLAALVRPPAGEYHLIAPVLDAGANGIIVPKVESAKQAAEIVNACRYYPEGNRGAAFSVSHDDYLPGDVAVKMKTANDAMICGILIETAAGVEKVDEIVSVPGLDLVWVGFLDLSISMRIPGQYDNPQFKEALRRVGRACEGRGIPMGILAKDSSQSLQYVRMGFRCISFSGDIWLLQDALTKGIQEVRRGLATDSGKTGQAGAGTREQ